MFAAVRNSLKLWRSGDRAPQRRRARRLAGLFAFEFVVVVLGVLVAQSLQEYASALRDRSDMHARRAHADFQIADLRTVSEYWLKLAPCLASQMDRVLGAVAVQKTPARADIATPAYFWSLLSQWDEKSLSTLRRSEGDEVASNYVSLVDVAAVETDLIGRLSSEWPAVTLAGQSEGSMDLADRAAVRLAALRIRGHLGRIVSNAREVVSRSSTLGIKADSIDSAPALPAHCRTTAS